jgi:hypothetical protein
MAAVIGGAAKRWGLCTLARCTCILCGVANTTSGSGTAMYSSDGKPGEQVVSTGLSISLSVKGNGEALTD